MSEANKSNGEDPKNVNSEESQPNSQAQANADSGTHPICQNAKDQEKCGEFVERLGQANENIDKRVD